MTNFIKPRIRSGDSYRGHILSQIGDLGVNFTFAGLNEGIVKMIEQFGSRLYYGYPHKDIFLYHWYSQKRYELIQRLNKFNSVDHQLSQNEIDDLGLYLHMARIARTQQWKYPSFITRLPSGEFDQTTGGTRAFAIGLTKPEPWKHFPILLLEHFDKDPGLFLDNPLHVSNDKQLTELLGGTYNEEIWDPTIRLSIEINKTYSNSYCLLKHVDDFSMIDNNVYYGREYLEKFIDWKSKSQGRPKLNIYTNYPHRIKDINGIWDWKVVGDTGNFESLMGDKVGWVENKVRNYHNNEKVHGNEYVCWLIKDRVIDLGDLLPWMDCDHTTFITDKYDFACYRPDSIFSTTFISMSYQE